QHYLIIFASYPDRINVWDTDWSRLVSMCAASAHESLECRNHIGCILQLPSFVGVAETLVFPASRRVVSPLTMLLDRARSRMWSRIRRKCIALQLCTRSPFASVMARATLVGWFLLMVGCSDAGPPP